MIRFRRPIDQIQAGCPFIGLQYNIYLELCIIEGNENVISEEDREQSATISDRLLHSPVD